MSPVGAIFVPFPPKTGTNMLHPLPLQSWNLSLDGWILARGPDTPAQAFYRLGLRYYSFPYFCKTCALEKLELVDQNCLERDLSALLLRTPSWPFGQATTIRIDRLSIRSKGS